MEYPEIHEDDYEEIMEKLTQNKNRIEFKINRDGGDKYKDDLTEVNSQIDNLNIRMIKTLKDRMIKIGLIDPEEIYDKDLTNFKNLSQDIRGKMLENIIGTSDDDKIATSLIKLYDILPQFSTNPELPNNIYKTVKLFIDERDKNFKLRFGTP